MQTGFHRIGGDAQDASHLLGGETLPIPEQKHRPQARRQAADGLLQHRSQLRPQELLLRQAAPVEQLPGDLLIIAQGQRLVDGDRLRLLPPKPHQGQVVGDAIQPGAQPSLPPEILQVLEGLQKRLLEHILRFLPAPQQPVGHMVDRVPAPVDHRREGLPVSPPQRSE
jgi:hypothetical protein